MEPTDLLSEVSKFLGVTLAQESLSEHAETCRQQLVSRIALGEVLPQAYIDMNGYRNPKLQPITDCYEAFDHCLDNTTPTNKQNIPGGYVNKLYNNLSKDKENEENIYANNDLDTDNYVNIKNPNQYEESTYIKPSSPLANTPVNIKPHLQHSNSNSERNSIISLKKESTDRASDSSSFTSGSTRYEESPEFLEISASALRHAATRCGTLGRKEKVMFVYLTKFYWAAVVNQTLFLFTNKKALKPQFDLNISGYKARPVAICSNNKDFKFELICPGKKTHQFIAEKQWEMDKWISAINSAGKGTETVREWSRELPSPPSETYEDTDSAGQTCPLLEAEAEYELPDTTLRQSSHQTFRQELAHLIHTKFTSANKHLINKAPEKGNSGQSLPSKASHSPKEVRRLPLPPTQQETYDHPLCVRPVLATQTPPSPELYECVQEELYQCINSQNARSLPLLPHEEEVPQQEVYDLPEPKVRPVFQPDVILQEEFYSVIDNMPDVHKPITQEALYKNVEDNFKNEEEGRNYDNLMPNPDWVVKQEGFPEKETDQECIYYMITEQRSPHLPSVPVNVPKNNTKNPPSIAKPPDIKDKLPNEIQLKFEEKKLSPVINNIATINSKQFSMKPQLKGVKPPIVNKT